MLGNQNKRIPLNVIAAKDKNELSLLQKNAADMPDSPRQPVGYRLALGEMARCASCRYFRDSDLRCRKFFIEVDPNYVCDMWRGRILSLSDSRLVIGEGGTVSDSKPFIGNFNSNTEPKFASARTFYKFFRKNAAEGSNLYGASLAPGMKSLLPNYLDKSKLNNTARPRRKPVVKRPGTLINSPAEAAKLTALAVKGKTAGTSKVARSSFISLPGFDIFDDLIKQTAILKTAKEFFPNLPLQIKAAYYPGFIGFNNPSAQQQQQAQTGNSALFNLKQQADKFFNDKKRFYTIQLAKNQISENYYEKIIQNLDDRKAIFDNWYATYYEPLLATANDPGTLGSFTRIKLKAMNKQFNRFLRGEITNKEYFEKNILQQIKDSYDSFVDKFNPGVGSNSNQNIQNQGRESVRADGSDVGQSDVLAASDNTAGWVASQDPQVDYFNPQAALGIGQLPKTKENAGDTNDKQNKNKLIEFNLNEAGEFDADEIVDALAAKNEYISNLKTQKLIEEKLNEVRNRSFSSNNTVQPSLYNVFKDEFEELIADNPKMLKLIASLNDAKGLAIANNRPEDAAAYNTLIDYLSNPVIDFNSGKTLSLPADVSNAAKRVNVDLATLVKRKAAVENEVWRSIQHKYFNKELSPAEKRNFNVFNQQRNNYYEELSIKFNNFKIQLDNKAQTDPRYFYIREKIDALIELQAQVDRATAVGASPAQFLQRAETIKSQLQDVLSDPQNAFPKIISDQNFMKRWKAWSEKNKQKQTSNIGTNQTNSANVMKDYDGYLQNNNSGNPVNNYLKGNYMDSIVSPNNRVNEQQQQQDKSKNLALSDTFTPQMASGLGQTNQPFVQIPSPYVNLGADFNSGLFMQNGSTSPALQQNNQLDRPPNGTLVDNYQSQTTLRNPMLPELPNQSNQVAAKLSLPALNKQSPGSLAKSMLPGMSALKQPAVNKNNGAGVQGSDTIA